MLPFDNRPWAKTLARTVIGLSAVAAIAVSYFLYSIEELHIPEVTGILLLLLTIIPPNIAILLRETPQGQTAQSLASETRPLPQ